MLRNAVACSLLAFGLSGTVASQTIAPGFSLTYLDRFKIDDEDEGLTEPSGLVLSQEGDALWTVSDDTKKVFKLSLHGKLQKDRSFKIDEKGLEGMTLGPTGDALRAVKEESNEILVISIASEKVTSRHALSDMAGFDGVEQHFSGGGANKASRGSPSTGTQAPSSF